MSDLSGRSWGVLADEPLHAFVRKALGGETNTLIRRGWMVGTEEPERCSPSEPPQSAPYRLRRLRLAMRHIIGDVRNTFSLRMYLAAITRLGI